MTVTFIIKANVDKMALAECSTDDQIIDTLTEVFTNESAKFGSDCWLDDVIENDDFCSCNAQEPNDKEGRCDNCGKSIEYKKRRIK